MDEPSLTPCPNEWHLYHKGERRLGIRLFLTCPECPPGRHYDIARMALRGHEEGKWQADTTTTRTPS